MTLNIKDPEAHGLARKLADHTGETMTRAVAEALRERLARVSRAHRPDTAQELLAIGRRCAAATFVETAIVVESQTKNTGSRQLDAFVRRAGITIEPVTEEQAHIARQAFTDFGKGRHPAGLNYGDCFSYALSKATREPCCSKERTSRRLT